MYDLREQLAEYAHTALWRYAFAKGTVNEDGSITLPAWAVKRWTRQMRTPYAELPESEKISDRDEADKILEIVFPALTAYYEASAAWQIGSGVINER